MTPLHPDKQVAVKAALGRRAKRRMKTDPNRPSLIQALAVEVYNEAAAKGKKGVDLVKGGTAADRRSARAAVANQPGNLYGAQAADGGKAQRKAMAEEAASKRSTNLLAQAPTGLDNTGKYIAVANAGKRVTAGKDLFSGMTAEQRRAGRKAAGVSTRQIRYIRAANAGKPKTGGTPAGTY